MQHHDGRLDHLDEFHQTLRRAVEAARKGIGVGIVLAVHLELADIDLADEARDVLVVLVARLGFRDADLLQPRGLQPNDGKFRDVPPNSSRRFTAQGEMVPVRRRFGTPYRFSISSPKVTGSNRPSGLSKTGLISLPALST